MAHDVFVSYSSKDKPIADAVVAGLEQRGVRCWFAPRDITPGSSWGDAIINAIEGSKIMVVILSGNSNESRQVVREVERAVAKGVIIIPFRIEKIDPTGAMAYFLSSEHWLDALTPPLEDHIEKLGSTIHLFLTENVRPEVGPRIAKTAAPAVTTAPRWKAVWIGALLLGVGILAVLAIVLIPQLMSAAPTNSPAAPTQTLFPTEPATPSPSPLLPSPTSTPLPPSPTSTLRPSRTPTLIPRIGSTRISPIDGMVMSYIPAGTFLMGSESGTGDSWPVHSVTLDAFWMDQTEVTNAMYARCVADSRCGQYDFSSNTRDNYYGNPTYANYPVMNVESRLATDYCTWAGKSLPTEAQWEYAARGGLVGALFPWGDEDPGCTLGAENGANYKLCSFGDTIAVGSFAPNGYGLYDMAGNVWESVIDTYAPYTSAAVENPVFTLEEHQFPRILRGGSWYDHDIYLRVSYRYLVDIQVPMNLGFRCVQSP